MAELWQQKRCIRVNYHPATFFKAVVPAKAGTQSSLRTISASITSRPDQTAMDKQSCVYILASQRYGTLYIGVTSDLVRCVWQHKEGLVDGFTKRTRCISSSGTKRIPRSSPPSHATNRSRNGNVPGKSTSSNPPTPPGTTSTPPSPLNCANRPRARSRTPSPANSPPVPPHIHRAPPAPHPPSCRRSVA